MLYTMQLTLSAMLFTIQLSSSTNKNCKTVLQQNHFVAIQFCFKFVANLFLSEMT